MNNKITSRRNFLKTAACGVTGLTAISPLKNNPLTGFTKKSSTGLNVAENIKLGVATYSLRNFNREDAIKMTKQCRVSYVSIKSFHLPYEDSPEELAAGRKAFEEAGLKIVSGGVITLKEDNDEDMKKYFDYAKACGMPMMIIAPTVQTMPRIEKFVKMYNIKVAIHNHGPEDVHFPGPQDAIKVIKNMDPRVGVCVDTGHTTRTGIDIIEAMNISGKRLLDFHIKDLRDLMDKGSQVAVGEGAMPVADIFRKLIKMNYQGHVNLEYEIKADDPLPGMMESFAYMRGVIAGMG